HFGSVNVLPTAARQNTSFSADWLFSGTSIPTCACRNALNGNAWLNAPNGSIVSRRLPRPSVSLPVGNVSSTPPLTMDPVLAVRTTPCLNPRSISPSPPFQPPGHLTTLNGIVTSNWPSGPTRRSY